MKKYSDEFLKQVLSVGLLGYPLAKVINVLDIEDADADDFRRDFNNPASEIYKAYHKGLDKADYEIDIQLFEMARSGDLKALEKFEERKANAATT